MKCNIPEAIEDLKELSNKKALDVDTKALVNKLLTDVEYRRGLIRSISDEAIRHNKAKMESNKAVQDKLENKDKLYSELVYTKRPNSNSRYTNSMLNLFSKLSNAQVKEVNSILNSNLELMAGSYDSKTDIIEVLKNPRVEDEVTGISNSVMSGLTKELNVDFLPDEVLDQLYSKEVSKQFEMDAKETLKELKGIKGKETLLHEYVHAVTKNFMDANPKHPATKRMNELYKMALSKQKEINTMTMNGDLVNSYWTTNVDEFVAEGLSNPDFMLALTKIPVEGKKLSLYEEFIKTVVNMLGMSKDKESMYSLLLDSTLVMAYEQGNREILDSLIVEEFAKQEIDKMTANELTEEALKCAKG